jgi:hypothetical protein
VGDTAIAAQAVPAKGVTSVKAVAAQTARHN